MFSFFFQRTFHSTDVFCTVSRLFLLLSFRLLCARLAVHSFTVYFGFVEFKDLNHNGNGKEYNGFVSVRYDSLFISLPFIAH